MGAVVLTAVLGGLTVNCKKATAQAAPDPNAPKLVGRTEDPNWPYNLMRIWYDPVRNVTCYQAVVDSSHTALSCLMGQNPGR